MKQSSFAFLLFILFISCQENNDQSAPNNLPPEPGLYEKIDEYFSALNELDKFNGVIYASKNGAEIIHKAYNLDPSESSTTYVSPESQFDIHSVSKLMAHYLIEKFEIEGKVKKHSLLMTSFQIFLGERRSPLKCYFIILPVCQENWVL